MSKARTLTTLLVMVSGACLSGCPSFLTHSTESICAHVQLQDVPGLVGTFHTETSDEDDITIQLARVSKGKYRAGLDGPAGHNQFEVQTCKLYGVWTAEVELDDGIWGQLPLSVGDDGHISTPLLEQGAEFGPVVDDPKLSGRTRSVSFVDDYKTHVVDNRTEASSERIAYLIVQAPKDLRWVRTKAAEKTREPSASDNEPSAPDEAPAIPSASARERLNRACSAGKGKACTELARVYLDGLGVERDIDQGVDLLERACDQGDSDGCFVLGGVGGILVSGQLGEHRRILGLELLETSCQAGSGTACMLAGAVYECEAGEKTFCKALTVSFERRYDGGFLLRGRAEEVFRKACTLGEDAGCKR